MRFNPPPNWPPAPPGWTPPPGWQPDASWPPLPPDWQLWVDDGTPTPTAPAPRRNALLVIGGLVAVLVVIVGVAVTVVLTRDEPTVTNTPASSSKQASSDEDQIKAAVKGFQDAWNEEDFKKFEPIVCADMRKAKEFNEDDFLAARQDSDEMNITVQSVEISGDKATATIKPDSGRVRDVPFVRESDGWKWCDP